MTLVSSISDATNWSVPYDRKTFIVKDTVATIIIYYCTGYATLKIYDCSTLTVRPLVSLKWE